METLRAPVRWREDSDLGSTPRRRAIRSSMARISSIGADRQRQKRLVAPRGAHLSRSGKLSLAPRDLRGDSGPSSWAHSLNFLRGIGGPLVKQRTLLVRSTFRAALVGMLGAALLIAGGCGSDGISPQRGPISAPSGASPSGSAGTAAPGVSSAKPTGPSTRPSSDGPPKLPKGVTTQNPKDPLAPRTTKQVARNGRSAHPTIATAGGPKPFDKGVNYEDGLRLTVSRVTQGKVAGHGPGVYPGRPVTTFHLELMNGSKNQLKLGVVVLTVTYGTPARIAHAIYDPESVDFSGVIRPGKTVRAAYGFSIPIGARRHVTLTADIDSKHHLAIFRGPVE